MTIDQCQIKWFKRPKLNQVWQNRQNRQKSVKKERESQKGDKTITIEQNNMDWLNDRYSGIGPGITLFIFVIPLPIFHSPISFLFPVSPPHLSFRFPGLFCPHLFFYLLSPLFSPLSSPPCLSHTLACISSIVLHYTEAIKAITFFIFDLNRCLRRPYLTIMFLNSLK